MRQGGTAKRSALDEYVVRALVYLIGIQPSGETGHHCRSGTCPTEIVEASARLDEGLANTKMRTAEGPAPAATKPLALPEKNRTRRWMSDPSPVQHGDDGQHEDARLAISPYQKPLPSVCRE